jgi:hypothetical protein
LLERKFKELAALSLLRASLLEKEGCAHWLFFLCSEHPCLRKNAVLTGYSVPAQIILAGERRLCSLAVLDLLRASMQEKENSALWLFSCLIREKL